MKLENFNKPERNRKMLNAYIVFMTACAVGGMVLGAVAIVFGLKSGTRQAQELARELLRMELPAGGETDEYALNISPLGIKAARAWQYYFAMRAGLKNFWECVPVLEIDDHLPSPFDVEADIADGKSRFARIDDGRSYTYVLLKGSYVVPNGYDCTMAAAEEIRDIVYYAKRKARHGDAKRD